MERSRIIGKNTPTCTSYRLPDCQAALQHVDVACIQGWAVHLQLNAADR